MPSSPYELWRAQELLVLRRVARLAGALLQEPTDPAMAGVREELAIALREQREWQIEGRGHGWGC